ncbi:hypothetical protein [Salininema proteolyticum]|uniref:DUF1648 domain-containing protein n=1 Tax=Salininema proteolyticum TaxID=1607685 RepID=A0ABV8U1N6_9ACTN
MNPVAAPNSVGDGTLVGILVIGSGLALLAFVTIRGSKGESPLWPWPKAETAEQIREARKAGLFSGGLGILIFAAGVVLLAAEDGYWGGETTIHVVYALLMCGTAAGWLAAKVRRWRAGVFAHRPAMRHRALFTTDARDDRRLGRVAALLPVGGMLFGMAYLGGTLGMPDWWVYPTIAVGIAACLLYPLFAWMILWFNRPRALVFPEYRDEAGG